MLLRLLEHPQMAVAWLFMIILAISVHEMAHAWMAYRLGDDTAARLGRITINPVSHFDPLGFACVLFAPIGWGKPVPYNPANLKNPNRDAMYIALAGPISNIIQAIILAVIFHLLMVTPVNNFLNSFPAGGAIFQATFTVCFVGVWINLALAFFNMIPLFPLDGEKVMIGLLPYEQAMKVEDFRQHSPYVLLILLMSGFFLPFSIIGYYFSMTAVPLRQLMIGM